MVRMDLNAKWHAQTLEPSEIKVWVLRQRGIEGLLKARFLTNEDIDHVVMCLYHIYQWYHGKRALGHFLTAVVKNDFGQACGRADDANSKVLPIYAMFLFNIAPADYKQKAITL